MGIVEQLKEEFEIHDEWLPYEIHPDTPPQGVLWENYFNGMNVEQFFSRLDMQGKPLGVRFNLQPLMSNSNLAMQAGEFARDNGIYEPYHAAVFKAFFSDCLDIGNFKVISGIVSSLGLDPDDLGKNLKVGKYISILEETKKDAAANMVTAAPTFLIEGGPKITGAQPLETFREEFRKL
jgi:predicted DsbA family dithiol-disulfide isomerase